MTACMGKQLKTTQQRKEIITYMPVSDNSIYINISDKGTCFNSRKKTE